MALEEAACSTVNWKNRWTCGGRELLRRPSEVVRVMTSLPSTKLPGHETSSLEACLQAEYRKDSIHGPFSSSSPSPALHRRYYAHASPVSVAQVTTRSTAVRPPLWIKTNILAWTARKPPQRQVDLDPTVTSWSDIRDVKTFGARRDGGLHPISEALPTGSRGHA
jgi:hypothetical protein